MRHDVKQQEQRAVPFNQLPLSLIYIYKYIYNNFETTNKERMIKPKLKKKRRR